MLPWVPLEGRVVGEPQIKFAESGTAVARFRVKAADRRKDEASGRWQDGEVLWVTVTAFGSLAEHVVESLVDGDQVLAFGKWSTAEWIDAGGTKRSVPKFVASAIGAGLQFAPRRHSPETMAKHRNANPPPAAASGYGQRFSDAVVGQAPDAGGEPTSDDPWA